MNLNINLCNLSQILNSKDTFFLLTLFPNDEMISGFLKIKMYDVNEMMKSEAYILERWIKLRKMNDENFENEAVFYLT